MKKILPSLLILLAMAQAINAAVFEIDLSYGLGFPDFSFSSAPLAISVYPWEYFGFSAGIEYSLRKKESGYENANGSMRIIDSDNDEFIFSYHFDKYEEELSTKLLQIPILLKFRMDYFYCGAGFKIGIPQNVRAIISYSGLETTGDLLEFGFHAEDMPEFGFLTNHSDSYETKIQAKTLLMLAVEGGARIKISKAFSLLFGAFADYSINKGFDRGLEDMVEWVENLDGASVRVSDGWRDWRPWSVGGAAKLSFAFGGSP